MLPNERRVSGLGNASPTDTALNWIYPPTVGAGVGALVGGLLGKSVGKSALVGAGTSLAIFVLLKYGGLG